MKRGRSTPSSGAPSFPSKQKIDVTPTLHSPPSPSSFYAPPMRSSPSSSSSLPLSLSRACQTAGGGEIPDGARQVFANSIDEFIIPQLWHYYDLQQHVHFASNDSTQKAEDLRKLIQEIEVIFRDKMDLPYVLEDEIQRIVCLHMESDKQVSPQQRSHQPRKQETKKRQQKQLLQKQDDQRRAHQIVWQRDLLRLAERTWIQTEQAHRAFDLLDRDGKQFIDAADLQRVVSELTLEEGLRAEDWGIEMLVEMIQAYEPTGDGHGILTRDDFVRIARDIKL